MLPKEDKRPIKVVYLCSPIDGISKKEALKWRKKAYDFLSSIAVCSMVPGLERINKKLTSQQIVKLDDTMISVSDCILINLDFLTLNKGEGKRLGTGTLIELGMGFVKRRIIIAFTTGAIPEHFKFLKGVYDYFFTSMEEALNKIKEINDKAENE